MLVDTAQRLGLHSLQVDKSSHMCVPKHVLLSIAAQNASSESAVQGSMNEVVKAEVLKTWRHRQALTMHCWTDVTCPPPTWFCQ